MVFPDVLHAMDEPVQLSPKVMLGIATSAVQSPASEFTDISDGQVIVGFWLSDIVTE